MALCAKYLFLIVVFSSLTNALKVNTYCETNFMEQKFPRLIQQPELFALSFYAVALCPTLRHARNYIGYTIFDWRYNQKFNRPPHRFIQPYTIVVSWIHKDDVAFRVHSEYVYTVRALFLILYNSATKRNPKYIIYSSSVGAMPVIKVLVDINHDNNKTDTFHVVCNGFCTEKEMPMDKNAGEEMLSVTNYHEILFRNGNGRLVNTLLTLLHAHFFRNFKDNPLRCLDLIIQHRADIRKSYLCKNLIMVTSYLAELHNITIKLYDVINDGKSVDRYGNHPFIAGPYGLSNMEDFNDFILASNIFEISESETVCYCKPKGLQKGFKFQYFVWVECITAELCVSWCCLLILSCIVVLDYSNTDNVKTLLRKFTVKMMQLLLLAFGELSIPYRKMLYICIAITGMFNAWFYENTITSLVTVATPEHPMKNLQDLVKNDYKFLWSNLSGDFRTTYRTEFRFSKVEDRINSSFVVLEKNVSLTRAVFFEYYYQNNKVALLTPKFAGENYRRIFQVELNRKLEYASAKCFVTPESFSPESYYWNIYTNNLHWLKITISRITNAGLNSFWDQRSNRLTDLLNKLPDDKHVSNADVINLQKLLPVIILFSSVYLSAGIVLVFERFKNSRNVVTVLH
ncbi:unnamed protein product [Orchesella dallaii]|uniref:Uncharacterized protein n=1 Tax=Orchesella dallaii TaxID=48710 RepID=A0ABP1RHL2_9HEXA